MNLVTLKSPLRSFYKSSLCSVSLLCSTRVYHRSMLSVCLPPHTNRNNEQSRISVWWDIENCKIPNGLSVFNIVHSITEAVRFNGIKGDLQFYAFASVSSIKEDLCRHGFNFIHIPNDIGVKNSPEKPPLVDLMYWVSQNPAPAHIFLISSDRRFADILHKLKMSNYNILLAAEEGEQAPGNLYSAASIMWQWKELAKGENLWGMHFKPPPDDPFHPCYGHYRGPIEYLFTEDSLYDWARSFECKHNPVPVAVLRELLYILCSYPGGLTITELHNELAKSNVSIDEAFYGYKRFSHFLLALPHIVEVQIRPDHQFFLRLAAIAVADFIQKKGISVQSMAGNGSRKVQVAKASAETRSDSSWWISHPYSETVRSFSVEELSVLRAVEESREQNSKRQNGLFNKLWINAERLNAPNASQNNVLMAVLRMLLKGAHSSSSAASNFFATGDTMSKLEVSHVLKAKIKDWCNFWRSDTSIDKPMEKSNEWSSPVEQNLKQPDDVASAETKQLDNDLPHLKKLNGNVRSSFSMHGVSNVILKLTSREQFAKWLDKGWSLILRRLVNFMVSDNECIKELPTRHPLEDGSAFAQPLNSSQLSPIFPTSYDDPLSIFVSLEDTGSRTRSETILRSMCSCKVSNDCWGLLGELLPYYPEGLSISCFKKHFFDKYGYSLDHERLGVEKLVSRFLKKPGVRVESTHIFSDSPIYDAGIESLGSKDSSVISDNEVSDSNSNEDSSNVEQSAGCKYRSVPVAVLKMLIRIVGYYHPQVLSSTELLYQLELRNVSIDKAFYGYKTFSSFLHALPHIVEVKSLPDGELYVHHPSFSFSTTIFLKVTADNGQLQEQSTCGALTIFWEVVEPSVLMSCSLDGKEETTKNNVVKESHDEKTFDAPLRCDEVAYTEYPNGKKNSGALVVESPIIPTEDHDSEYQNGNRTNIDTGTISDDIVSERFGTADVSPSKSTSSKLNHDVSNLDDEVLASARHELFSKNSFWRSLQAFLTLHPGLDVIFNSTSREQFADRLQKQGPLILRSLEANDMRQLVDILISEKKWIEDFPNRSPRFNKTMSSSIFSSSSSSYYDKIILPNRPPVKYVNDVLRDCEMLVLELFSKHPEGFSVHCFGKHFFDKYGYPLYPEKLGYIKMASLLFARGAKVESDHALPPDEKSLDDYTDDEMVW